MTGNGDRSFQGASQNMFQQHNFGYLIHRVMKPQSIQEVSNPIRCQRKRNLTEPVDGNEYRSESD